MESYAQSYDQQEGRLMTCSVEGCGLNLDGYWVVTDEGVRQYEHILIAEKALGKPLPKGAIVHHVNNKPWDNHPENLVICPSQAYHMELHNRMNQLGISFDG